MRVRIVRDDPHEKLVRWLALNAMPTKLKEEAYPGLKEQRAEVVAKTLCGNWLPPSYWTAFSDLNGRSPSPKDKLGEAAYGYDWPACFWIEHGDFETKVTPENLASNIYLNETGSPGQRKTWANFFARSGVADVSNVPVGTVLKYHFRTRPVLVVPRSGTKAEFRKALERKALQVVAQAEDAVRARDEDPIVRDGEIVTAKQDATQPGKTPPGCKDKLGQPFDLDRVAYAFNYKASVVRDDIRVMVADNGFFGAFRSNGKVYGTSQFDRGFFAINVDTPSGKETIGPVLALTASSSVSPFNRETFADDAVLDADSGHGTHVAGSASGAAARKDKRFFSQDAGQNAWLRMNHVAFSPGKREIPAFPLSQFSEILRRVNYQSPALVNMSLKFGRAARGPIEAMLGSNPGTLFVAASGNDTRDLDSELADAFPAGLGGAENLLVVAAEDGQGNLTEFSNYGAETVDIAAPGCNIASTLDGETGGALLSGTSQAAPTVTFAAALLARRQLNQDRIKPRLMISGDLLDGVIRQDPNGDLVVTPVSAQAPAPIRSQSRLNIATALYFSFDYLRYRDEAGTLVEVLGTLHTTSGPACGGASRSFKKVVAFKRAKSGQAWCFWRDDLSAKPVTTADEQTLEFEVIATINADGKPIDEDRWIDPIPLTRVEQFIRSEEHIAQIK
ncbi:S8 family serine peptidase [Caulobacter vibrioides]|uniref:S8 family serine peptidase n=1 Tax=Caulobacter vibrioides TaxID=155892 RepID=UPI0015E65419|nr:S8 family serine peptidase [Caulobacter vibrioides]